MNTPVCQNPSCGRTLPDPLPPACRNCGTAIAKANTGPRKIVGVDPPTPKLPNANSPQPATPAPSGAASAKRQSPPPPPSSSAPTPAQPGKPSAAVAPTTAQSGLIGTISGSVEVDTKNVPGGLVSLTGLVTVLILLFMVVAVATNPALIARLELPAFILLAVMLIVPDFRRQIPSMIGSVLGMATRAAAGATTSATRQLKAPSSQTVEVRRFRVLDSNRQLVECHLSGALVGGSLRQGDQVQVFGRRFRGVVNVRSVRVVNSNATVRGRVPVSVRLTALNAWLSRLLLLGIVAAVIRAVR